MNWIERLQRRLRKPGAAKAYLDSELIGPQTDAYQAIEAASALVSKKLDRVIQRYNYKPRWSHGDSKGWRVIVSMSTEAELKRAIIGKTLRNLASEIAQTINTAVVLDDAFTLYVELDSDERVNRSEGWFFRLKSDPQKGREFVFDASGHRRLA